MTFTQPLCLSPKGCTMCVCLCVYVYNNQNSTYGCRGKEEGRYAMYNPFPHRFVFSVFLHSYPMFPHRYFALFLLFLLSFRVSFKPSFILSKFDQLIDNSNIFIYTSSCMQHVCGLKLQAELLKHQNMGRDTA